MASNAIANALFMLGTWLLIGILNIVTGFSIKKRGLKDSPLAWNTDSNYWEKQIEKWGITRRTDVASVVVKDVMHCWGQIQYPGQICSGVALILTILCYFCILVVTHGTPSVGAWPYWIGFILSYLLGLGVGYIMGVYHMRTATSRVARYADLRPRKLSDYRSAILLIVSATFVTYMFIVTFILMPSLGSTLSLPGTGLSIKVPNTFLAIWSGPVSLLLLFIAGEMVMVCIAKLPRLLITTDPAIAQRADEMLRAKVIGMLQGVELYALGFLGFFQWDILSQSLGSWHSPLLITALSFIILLALLGIAVPTLLKDRVGGKVTGWPWQALGGAQ